tara:strand:- start:3028 stop:3234 length:207 start_codon:yes stop_codon:yes gene_type:complete
MKLLKQFLLIIILFWAIELIYYYFTFPENNLQDILKESFKFIWIKIIVALVMIYFSWRENKIDKNSKL